jgi:putative membrane protein
VPTDAPAWQRWPFVPDIVLGLLGLAVLYALAAGPLRARLVRLGGPPPPWQPPGAVRKERPGHLAVWQVAAFFGALLVAGLALLSPLHVLGESYLLSAHMVQHLLITAVVPPLLLLGTPGWMLRPLLCPPASGWGGAGWLRPPLGAVRRLAGTLLTPIPAFLLFNAVFLVWHAPPLYQLALVNPLVHAFEHSGLIVLALATWWPICGPLAEYPRLPHGAQVLYLFFQSLPPTLLGAIIALSEVSIYPHYWEAPRVFGLSPLADQQLGGLIMWIPGALTYFVALSVIFFIWLERRAPHEEPPYGDVNPDRARSLVKS